MLPKDSNNLLGHPLRSNILGRHDTSNGSHNLIGKSHIGCSAAQPSWCAYRTLSYLVHFETPTLSGFEYRRCRDVFARLLRPLITSAMSRV